MSLERKLTEHEFEDRTRVWRGETDTTTQNRRGTGSEPAKKGPTPHRNHPGKRTQHHTTLTFGMNVDMFCINSCCT